MQLKRLLNSVVTKLVQKDAKWLSLYRRVCKPNGFEYASMLKSLNIFHKIGSDVFINDDTNWELPKLISIGNNVRLASCFLFPYDGVINMLEKAYGPKLDSVGPIVIGNNVFIGHHALVLKNVTIGNNVIVAARSLVNKDIPSGSIVAGVPARIIGRTDDLAATLHIQSKSYPWYDLICERTNDNFVAIEPTLNRMREEYFFFDND